MALIPKFAVRSIDRISVLIIDDVLTSPNNIVSHTSLSRLDKETDIEFTNRAIFELNDLIGKQTELDRLNELMSIAFPNSRIVNTSRVR